MDRFFPVGASALPERHISSEERDIKDRRDPKRQPLPFSDLRRCRLVWRPPNIPPFQYFKFQSSLPLLATARSLPVEPSPEHGRTTD